MSYLIWLILPGVLILLSSITYNWAYKRNYEIYNGVIIWSMSIILFFILVAWPAYYFRARSATIEFYAVRDTIKEFRLENPKHENIALILKAAESNQWLKKSQYWASKPLLKMFWPQEILELKPIK